MKEKIIERLTAGEIADLDSTFRNKKLRTAILRNLSLNILQIRLVNDSPQWRGWIVSYED